LNEDDFHIPKLEHCRPMLKHWVEHLKFMHELAANHTV
jgi:hypothetical protein